MSGRRYAVATGASVESPGADEQLQLAWPDVPAWLGLDSPAEGQGARWHLFGQVTGPRRNADNVSSRSVLTIDADTPRTTVVDDLSGLLGCALVAHTTKSHQPQAPRWRVLAPLDRDLDPEEYALVARAVMHDGGAAQFDHRSAAPTQVMYFPAGGEHYRQLVIDGPAMDTAHWLRRAKVLDLRPTPETPHRPGPEPCDCDPPAERPPYTARAVKDELGRLRELGGHAWHAGAGWDRTVYAVACNLREIANTPCMGYGLDEAEADLLENAPTDQVWGEAMNAEKWRSAESTVGDKQRPCRRAPDFARVSGGPGVAPAGRSGGGPVPLAVQLREHVEAGHDLFPAEDDGRVFALPRGGGRAQLVNGSFVIRACAGIGRKAGTLSAAATEAAKVLVALAEATPPRPISLRARRDPGRVVLDLAQPGRSRCVVVTAGGWEVRDAPPDGVVFRDPGRPLPDPERGGDADELRRLLRWAPEDERWQLVRGWLACALLDGAARPILGLFGPQGSAKSTTGRFVVGVLDPKPKGGLGSAFGKNRADDETKALQSYLVAWDNVSSLSAEGADLLSRLVTGDNVERRRLYTDADVVKITYRRTGVLTGISLPRGVKADTLDRLVLIHLDAPRVRVSEDQLEAEWAAAHPRVLGGVLDLLSRAVAGGGRNPDGLRNGDYAEALWAVDPALYEAYAANVRDARADMAGEDPFIVAIVAWVDNEGGRWEGTAEECRRRAGLVRRGGDGWWPPSARSFSEKVTENAELLREVGVTVSRRKSHGTRLMALELDRGPRTPHGAPDLL